MGKIVAKADFCYQRGTFDSAKGRKKNNKNLAMYKTTRVSAKT